MILIIIGLYAAGAILTGLTFYSMTWAGQHVLRRLRVAVFEHLHRLSVSYYAEQEVGDLMSRITNDTETIQQALNFALVNVLSGVLFLVWIAYNMLTKSLPFALLSMMVVPVMAMVTFWFSTRRAGLSGARARRWAMSMPSCKRASQPCARCRRSTAPRRTSSISG